MKIYAVGLGPGNTDYLAPRAREAILQSDVVTGYTGYVKLIAGLIGGKEIIATGMKKEAERCKAAINEALKGKQVSVVSGGDPGIYGMAALLCELTEKIPTIEIEVIPGITAAVSAAAILGSPLTNDFAVISLSDLLTPWEIIEKRLEACVAADMALCLYNPESKERKGYLHRACAIISRHMLPETKCGYVRNAFRDSDSESRVCTLDELSKARVDMFTTVIIGNSRTKIINGKLVTPRGYRL